MVLKFLLTLGICAAFLVSFLTPAAFAEEVARHELSVRLDPAAHRLEATDLIRLPEATQKLVFTLHSGLTITAMPDGAALTHVDDSAGITKPLDVKRYTLTLATPSTDISLTFSGEINDPPVQLSSENRAFAISTGVISGEGVYLSGGSHWYPQIEDQLLTFDMTVALPGGWDAVAQGERLVHDKGETGTSVRWETGLQQDEIYLIAAEFIEYSETDGKVDRQVFLRTEDPEMAARYNDATRRYVKFYQDMLGPYPYTKFALVENFWDTGYGMPSFTLLGSNVIRFPFIINGSYPHEILHNWWGNGVYVDYESGNWAEGLTAYLADHLISEVNGGGPRYRRTSLQRYTDFAAGGRDFALTEFRSRNSAASEAVGYGKTMMFFHMLRQRYGDEAFAASLNRFYTDNIYQRAAFDDMRKAFDAITGENLAPEFDQWVKRAGAPTLRVNAASASKTGGGYTLTLEIAQEQDGAAYDIDVPVAVTLEGRDAAAQSVLRMTGKNLTAELPFDARPLRVDVDPEFDIFRRLHRQEIPPALTLAFGAEEAVLVLPSAAPEHLLEHYRGLAETWSTRGATKLEIVLDSDLSVLPSNKTVWLLGWENALRPLIDAAAKDYGAQIGATEMTLDGKTYTAQDHSAVLTFAHPNDPEHALVWISGNSDDAIDGLASKLPHYSSYSYLAFEGGEPVNVASGRWSVAASPLSRAITQADGSVIQTARAALAPRTALAAPE